MVQHNIPEGMQANDTYTLNPETGNIDMVRDIVPIEPEQIERNISYTVLQSISTIADIQGREAVILHALLTRLRLISKKVL